MILSQPDKTDIYTIVREAIYEIADCCGFDNKLELIDMLQSEVVERIIMLLEKS